MVKRLCFVKSWLWIHDEYRVFTVKILLSCSATICSLPQKFTDAVFLEPLLLPNNLFHSHPFFLTSSSTEKRWAKNTSYSWERSSQGFIPPSLACMKLTSVVCKFNQHCSDACNSAAQVGAVVGSIMAKCETEWDVWKSPYFTSLGERVHLTYAEVPCRLVTTCDTVRKS